MSELAKQLRSIARGEGFGTSGFPPGRHACFHAGGGSPMGSPEDDDDVPRLWCICQAAENLVQSHNFEGFCARLDLKGPVAVSIGIRKHAEELVILCNRTSALVDEARRLGIAKANRACLEFLGATQPSNYPYLLGPFDLKSGETFAEPIDGDPDRRAALAACLERGHPGVIDIEAVPAPPRNVRSASMQYWSALDDAELKIKRVRWQLTDRMLRFADYLQVAAESGEDKSPTPHGRGTEMDLTDDVQTGKHVAPPGGEVPPTGPESIPPCEPTKLGELQTSTGTEQQTTAIDVRVWASSTQLRDRFGLAPDRVGSMAKRRGWPVKKHRGLNWYRLADIRREWPEDTSG